MGDFKCVIKSHFGHVCSKMTAMTRLIWRYKNFYPAPALLMFTKSLVLSHLDYCLPIWGNLCGSDMHKLDKLIFAAFTNIPLFKSVTRSRMFWLFEKIDISSSVERRNLYMLKFLFNVFVMRSNLHSVLSNY